MPVDPVVGSIAGGIGGIIQGIGSGKRQRKNIRAQKQADLELAEYAYSKDLEQWERENLYNSPAAQMGRFEEAGLNPHLIYGQGSVAGNTAGQGPKYQQVRTNYSGVKPMINPLQIIGAFQDIEMKNAQIDLVRQQGAVKAEEANFANIFFQGRGNKMFSGAERDFSFNRYLMGQAYTDRDGKRHGPGSRLWDYNTYQLQAKEQGVRSLKYGANFKKLQNEWMEWMNKAGIGGKIAIPLLRMIFK